MSISGLLNKGAISVTTANPAFTEKLGGILAQHPLWFTADEANEIAKTLGISIPQLMIELIPIARKRAVVPISDYRVGSCAMGASGNLYLGANLEFQGQSLIQTVHSEQCCSTNAMCHGEKGLQVLAVSAEPCGYCRQYLNEMQDASGLIILLPNQPVLTLQDLLPRSFGPKNLGVEAGMMGTVTDRIALDKVDSELAERALQAANLSYTPYSHSPSGVALRTKTGITVSGFYAENAAYNPGVCPMQAALMLLTVEGGNFADIESCVLVEKEKCLISQTDNTRSLLAALAPDSSFSVYYGKEA